MESKLLHIAYYKFVNILSEMSPLALIFNPMRIQPTIVHNKKEKDTDIGTLMESEEYQQIAAESRFEMTAEEEATLADWLLNPDKPSSNNLEDFEGETVDADEPLIFEQERQVKGGNSGLAGTPNGLAGPTTAMFTLAYYMTIDDAVVLLDPDSTQDEKMVAGLFLIPTPVKFAKSFLKHADDVDGAVNAGRKANKVNGANNQYNVHGNPDIRALRRPQ